MRSGSVLGACTTASTKPQLQAVESSMTDRIRSELKMLQEQHQAILTVACGIHDKLLGPVSDGSANPSRPIADGVLGSIEGDAAEARDRAGDILDVLRRIENRI